MKKLFFLLALTSLSAFFISCVTVTKKPDLYTGSVRCGFDRVIWESLPASEHNTYDVTVAFTKSPCGRQVELVDSGGHSAMTNISKARPFTFSRVTKIILHCIGNQEMGTNCPYTIQDVRKSPTAAGATVYLDTNSVPTPVSCGMTSVAFTATNTAGANVTISWEPGTTCKISLSAERASGSTNRFIPGANSDSQLSTITAVKRLIVNCDTSPNPTNPCSYHVVETEY